MSLITGHEPYAPVDFEEEDDSILNEKGITIRQHFAAMAMQGLFAGDTDDALTVASVAKLAVECADALIDELNKTDKS